MMPQYHALSSFAFSTVAFGITGKWEVALATFAVGVLIDADHLIDGKGIKTSPQYYAQTSRLLILLHSYELLIPLWLLVPATYAFWTTCSFLMHLVLDYYAWNPPKLLYFFTYRAAKGFRERGRKGADV